MYWIIITMAWFLMKLDELKGWYIRRKKMKAAKKRDPYIYK